MRQALQQPGYSILCFNLFCATPAFRIGNIFRIVPLKIQKHYDLNVPGHDLLACCADPNVSPWAFSSRARAVLEHGWDLPELIIWCVIHAKEHAI